MLKSASVVGFIPVKDFRRAEAFYEGKLGLRLVARDDFALVFASGGTTIRVVKVGDFKAAPFTILGWQVKNVKASVGALGKRGVVFERYPGMTQDARGVWTAPGGACVAWFKDPDGNVLSVSSVQTKS
jgi:catechol 2,3-dioxygenase-like lactoylglutathione lyase family enzyme